MLRESVRALAEERIAPHAAEVDETGQFPQAAHDALVESDFHAIHIPEQYGGAGGDALAACLVIEEVARRPAAVHGVTICLPRQSDVIESCGLRPAYEGHVVGESPLLLPH